MPLLLFFFFVSFGSRMRKKNRLSLQQEQWKIFLIESITRALHVYLGHLIQSNQLTQLWKLIAFPLQHNNLALVIALRPISSKYGFPIKMEFLELSLQIKWPFKIVEHWDHHFVNSFSSTFSSNMQHIQVCSRDWVDERASKWARKKVSVLFVLHKTSPAAAFVLLNIELNSQFN